MTALRPEKAPPPAAARDVLERLGRGLAVGLALASVALELLALAGWFQAAGVTLVLAASAAGGAWAACGGPTGDGSTLVRTVWVAWAAPLVPLGVLALWLLPPAEFVLGGLDPGAYLNGAVALAAAGGFRFPESLPAVAGPEAQAVFTTQSAVLHSALHPGFYWDGTAATPQFPLLLTVWGGALAVFGGVSGALLVPPLAMLAAVLFCHLLGRHFLGTVGGLAAAVLLGSHPWRPGTPEWGLPKAWRCWRACGRAPAGAPVVGRRMAWPPGWPWGH